MKRNKRIPKSIKSILWSYDINNISLERDKETIITQCLNYGTLKEVKWLFKTYGEEEIKKVISHPRRGQWWRKVLNFWIVVLDINLPKEVFENAIIKIKPQFPQKSGSVLQITKIGGKIMGRGARGNS